MPTDRSRLDGFSFSNIPFFAVNGVNGTKASSSSGGETNGETNGAEEENGCDSTAAAASSTEDLMEEEEEDDGRGPPKLFVMNFVNSYGNAQLEQIENNGEPITITGKL